ncbi:MAG TPA: hypothetical protein ENH82_14685 [bacterium]|nr:hypothetical protein [bacterium]
MMVSAKGENLPVNGLIEMISHVSLRCKLAIKVVININGNPVYSIVKAIMKILLKWKEME